MTNIKKLMLFLTDERIESRIFITNEEIMTHLSVYTGIFNSQQMKISFEILLKQISKLKHLVYLEIKTPNEIKDKVCAAVDA